MTHAADHIICGGAGTPRGEKSIKIYDHDLLNVAIRLERDPAELERLGYSSRQIRTIEKLGDRINRQVHAWYEKLASAGIEPHYYEPHAENLE